MANFFLIDTLSITHHIMKHIVAICLFKWMRDLMILSL